MCLSRLIETLLQPRFFGRLGPDRTFLLIKEILRRPMKSLQKWLVPGNAFKKPARFWKMILYSKCELMIVEEDGEIYAPRCTFIAHAANTVAKGILPAVSDDAALKEELSTAV